jgi:hypothetical protein
MPLALARRLLFRLRVCLFPQEGDPGRRLLKSRREQGNLRANLSAAILLKLAFSEKAVKKKKVPLSLYLISRKQNG